MYDLSDSLAALKKSDVYCKYKCDFLYDFWFYIKAIKNVEKIKIK